jgi:hypothetical protein
MTGLAWFDPDDMLQPLSLRHDAQQVDRLSKYGWRKHDGRGYGWQEVLDGDYAMNVTMVGGRPGGRARRLDGQPGGWAPRRGWRGGQQASGQAAKRVHGRYHSRLHIPSAAGYRPPPAQASAPTVSET